MRREHLTLTKNPASLLIAVAIVYLSVHATLFLLTRSPDWAKDASRRLSASSASQPMDAR
jgi:hypothetical protein